MLPAPRKYTTFPELCLSGPALSLASSGWGGLVAAQGVPWGSAPWPGQRWIPKKEKKNQTPKPPFFPRLCAFGCKPPAQPAQFTSSHQCWQDGDQSGSDFSNFLPRQPILLIANETVVYFCIKEKSIFFLKLCLPFPFRPSAWDPFPAVLLQVTQESPRGVTLFLDPWQEGVGGALLSPGIFCFIFCVCVCVSLQGSSSKSL